MRYFVAWLCALSAYHTVNSAHQHTHYKALPATRPLVVHHAVLSRPLHTVPRHAVFASRVWSTPCHHTAQQAVIAEGAHTECAGTLVLQPYKRLSTRPLAVLLAPTTLLCRSYCNLLVVPRLKFEAWCCSVDRSLCLDAIGGSCILLVGRVSHCELLPTHMSTLSVVQNECRCVSVLS